MFEGFGESSTFEFYRFFLHTPSFLGNDSQVSWSAIEMISESLGHKSIKTTQIYLKGFELRERTEVNKGNLSYIRNYRLGR